MKINNKHLGFDRNISSPSHNQLLFLIGNKASIANSEKKTKQHTH